MSCPEEVSSSNEDCKKTIINWLRQKGTRMEKSKKIFASAINQAESILLANSSEKMCRRNVQFCPFARLAINYHNCLLTKGIFTLNSMLLLAEWVAA